MTGLCMKPEVMAYVGLHLHYVWSHSGNFSGCSARQDAQNMVGEGEKLTIK